MHRRRKNKTELASVTYGGAIIRLYLRSNGMVALKWREAGTEKATTRNTEEKARAWARLKVRELADATGGRFVPISLVDRMEWLDRIAGGSENTPALLSTLESALQTLGGSRHLLTEAAAWYAKQGLASARSITVTQAKESFLAEYEAHHPLATVSPIRSELRALAAAHGERLLLDLNLPILDAHVRRGSVAKRTIQNRIAHLTTFFNRGIELGWWPEGRKPPSLSIKRPRLEDKAPEILTPHQGLLLLDAVSKPRAGARKNLIPYLLIAGWLGCRPSECTRLDWADFDWEHGILHVRAAVAGKTASERWVHMKPELVQWLRPHAKKKGKVCMQRSSELISLIAREEKIVKSWPPDVLRHSYITYRLGEKAPIEEVAEESGNSPGIIRSNYRRPIPPGVAEKWWACLTATA